MTSWPVIAPNKDRAAKTARQISPPRQFPPLFQNCTPFFRCIRLPLYFIDFLLPTAYFTGPRLPADFPPSSPLFRSMALPSSPATSPNPSQALLPLALPKTYWHDICL
ncbi:hypothetical protein [Paenibacillus tyrfis]|uniref:hypothetical protein n=1 Tax=Paenibacillus tyrfis TaxID=1501230 RepID=UPI00209CF446|nr:hypothetical protein [Paenibacillus tyrfis]MCP1311224.1 hypothetical protein [Paenibacillus tyrfis]